MANELRMDANPQIDPSGETIPFPPEPRHFEYIDALRGWAFLGVLATHCAMAVGDFGGRSVLSQGRYGVQLFFLVSAVTLCHSMESRGRSERHPILNFYLRRFFRIAPLFWIAILFYQAVPNSMPLSWSQYWAPGGVRPVDLVLTATFLHGWHPSTFDSVVPGGWSVAVEMGFYLLFPWIYRVTRSLRRSLAALLISLPCIYVLFRFVDPALRAQLYSGSSDDLWNAFVNLWLPAQIPVFLTGIALYHLARHPLVAATIRDRHWAAIVFGFSVLFGLSFLEGTASGVVPLYMWVVFSLAMGVLSLSGGAMRVVTPAALRFLGKISFSCYLAHFAGLGLALRIFGYHLSPTMKAANLGSPAANASLFFELATVTLLITIPVATLIHVSVERWGIAIGKKAIRRIALW